MTDLAQRLERIEQAQAVAHDHAVAAHDEMLTHQLNDSTEFSKAERRDDETKAKLIVLEHRLFDEQEGFLPRLLAQTTKTNGRVRWAEKMIWLAIGGLGVITAVIIPVIVALVKHLP